MDSYTGRQEHESSAKRIKLDFGEFSTGVLCNEDSFSNFSTSIGDQIEASEGITADCDSDYEASTVGYLSTPTHNLASPHTDTSDLHESLSSSSESLHRTHQDLFALETSQDSIELEEDNTSSVSNFSELSGLSKVSGAELKDCLSWIQKQIAHGVDPRIFLNGLGIDPEQIPPFVDDFTLWKWIINMLEEPPRRNKLRHVNTLDDVVRLMKGAKNIIVLTGAGVSVSCGIPDFRSKDGIYSRLAIDFPDLPSPQSMFDINYFTQDPRPFYKFARDIYPGKFKPSPCHRFIKLLERHQKLLRNYTQNIDTLEKVAEIEKVIECHGSFATATCTKCDQQVTAEGIRDIILSQKIPVCEICQPNIGPSISIDELTKREPNELKKLVMNGIMKPDIVFFGEGLPDKFHDAMAEDKCKCDLLLVIGSSLKVHPVALIPSSLPSGVPQILINREPLTHCQFDVELLGDCDVIINHICQLLGNTWNEAVYHKELLKETPHLLPCIRDSPKTNENSVPAKSSISFNVTKTHENETCKCKNINKNSLLTSGISCNCPNSSAIMNKDADFLSDFDEAVRSTKERHMSIDSARDSGIGDNSNFTDTDALKLEENFDEVQADSNSEANCQVVPTLFGAMLMESCSSNINCTIDTVDNLQYIVDIRGLWEPKEKRSLTERLPKNSFYHIAPSRYIFPGAEVYYDPDEKYNYFEIHSDSSENESEVEKPDGSL